MLFTADLEATASGPRQQREEAKSALFERYLRGEPSEELSAAYAPSQTSGYLHRPLSCEASVYNVLAV